jgi:L-ribulose-5-phosphate 3-epimerase
MGIQYLEAYAEQGLYTMQGRLCAPEDGRFQSFPRNSWKKEIELTPKVPLRGIEWIYDMYGKGANPIETSSGRALLNETLARAGVRVASICADYFMDFPLAHPDPETRLNSQAKLEWLISICPTLDIKRIVLPFVDASKITDKFSADLVLTVLHAVLPKAQISGVELHLETDMGPSQFRSFLNQIENPIIKVNYDSGNSSSLGYKPAEEFAAYGERIGSFHIKDRLLGGKTVPLGHGNTDFTTLRNCLVDFDYRGDFVLQAARGTTGEELDWLSRINKSACQWLRGEPNFKLGE